MPNHSKNSPASQMDSSEQTKPFAVKVHTTAVEYDYNYPWRAPAIKSWSGSGFAIEGERLITNAHVAAGSTHLEIRIAGDSRRYKAKVEQIGHDCDLAMLSVADKSFWDKVKPMEIGDTPARRQDVEVVGFPMGGDNLCITDGRVSRLENTTYVQGFKMLLTSQLTAAINPGNSGGAVISDGKVIGVVHQGMPNGQNIGYMIPAGVLKQFLSQFLDEYSSFPGLSLETQTLQNPSLREHFSLDKSQGGILVTDIPETSAARGRLEKGDILLAIDGHKIGDDGTVTKPPMQRVDFNESINSQKIGDKVKFTVKRGDDLMDINVILKNTLGSTKVIKPMQYGRQPSYYIANGTVAVQPLTLNYMFDTRTPYDDREKTNPEEELVIINRLLKSDATLGYGNFNGSIVSKVNGLKINCLAEFIEATENSKGNKLVIETDDNEVIVVPKLSKRQIKEVFKTYQIQHDRSEDLREAEIDFECGTPYSKSATAAPLLFSRALSSDSSGSSSEDEFSSDNELEDPFKQQAKSPFQRPSM